MPHVGASAGFGDRQRTDQLAGQGGADELLDQPLVTAGDHVWHGDADGEQRGEHPAGGPGLMQFLADDGGVGRVATFAADLLGKSDPEQTGLACPEAEISGQFADALPLADMGQDLAFGEGAHCFTQLLPFGRGPDAHETSSSGISTCRLRNHSPRPLAWGSNRAW